MKFVIKNEEFELDFLDADVMEMVEDAIVHVEERNTVQAYEGLTQSQLIRKQCSVIFDFFDEVFGDGAHKRIFKGKCNLIEALIAFEDFVKAKNSSTDEIKEISERYSPNRAQRRAAVKSVHGNGGNNRNGGNRNKNRNNGRH